MSCHICGAVYLKRKGQFKKGKRRPPIQECPNKSNHKRILRARVQARHLSKAAFPDLEEETEKLSARCERVRDQISKGLTGKKRVKETSIPYIEEEEWNH